MNKRLKRINDHDTPLIHLNDGEKSNGEYSEENVAVVHSNGENLLDRQIAEIEAAQKENVAEKYMRDKLQRKLKRTLQRKEQEKLRKKVRDD